MGLLSRLGVRFGRRSARSVAEREPRLAFVLLNAPTMPAGDAIVAAFRMIAPASASALSLDAGGDPSTLQFSVGNGGSLIVSLMPLAIPGGEADQHFLRSFTSWETPDRRLAPHAAHLVAFFRQEAGHSRRDGLILFTYLLAAVAEASQASAIYWGDAGATHDARIFIDTAREQDPDEMLVLWCGMEVVSDGPSRASLLSAGMGPQFGMMELRVTTPLASVAECLGAAYDILAYAVSRGSPVPEGETVGRSEEERLPVRYEPHPVDPTRRIWRVDFP